MTPRPQLDEDQMARMDDFTRNELAHIVREQIWAMRRQLERDREFYRQMGCETRVREIDEVLK